MMEEMYGLHPAADCPEQRPPPPPQENMLSPPDYHALTPPAFRDWFPIFGSGQMFSVSPAESDSSSMVAEIQRSESEEEISDIIRTRIASHPLCPKLLDAYIDCQKVGASPEIVNLLDEIRRENDLCKRTAVSTSLGTDPELDEFMEAYCNILTKCKSDLARPFEEATSFFNNVERQLSNLCDGTSRISVSEAIPGHIEIISGDGLILAWMKRTLVEWNLDEERLLLSLVDPFIGSWAVTFDHLENSWWRNHWSPDLAMAKLAGY